MYGANSRLWKERHQIMERHACHPGEVSLHPENNNMERYFCRNEREENRFSLILFSFGKPFTPIKRPFISTV